MCGNIRSRVVVPSGLRWPALLAVGGRMPEVDVLGVQPRVLQRGSVLRVRAPLSNVVRGATTSALVSGRGELIKAARGNYLRGLTPAPPGGPGHHSHTGL